VSIIEETERYYAARAPIYNETAGYLEFVAEKARDKIKARYRKLFAGHDVLDLACGTGYWTSAIAETAKSILGVDIHEKMLEQARERCRDMKHVQFQKADAYKLEGVPGGFSAAFGTYWWSHMPVEQTGSFLDTLHAKLKPGAMVLFLDQLPYEGLGRRKDANGNTLEQRILPDGRKFEIIKNFPDEACFLQVLKERAENIQYIARVEEKTWSVVYNTL
jgi:demethylmenaquinone methyltransferase/2-methoxy-6-polyprenyl-1,4-benzoquinol methylase